jgi:RHH-type rel operon transcriptional repressor/antitoxin RelB
MITLRLDSKLEQNINTIAQQMGVSKSELIRKSIVEYINKLDKPSAWELGSEIFGQYASDTDSLSADRKTLIKNKLESKRCVKS